MTISIGLIPNNEAVMLIQDSEVTYPGVGFTQDIYRKIQEIDKHAVVGVTGRPILANEILELIKGEQYKSSRELSDKVEQAYHQVRNKHLQRGFLAKYGFSDIRDVIAPPQGVQINPKVVDEILHIANNANNFFTLDLMLATNYESPLIYITEFPGSTALFSNLKDYAVSGSGGIMALEKMGAELENYRWQKELSIDEGIDILMKAGKASEKHVGVGGPFEIVYIEKQKDGTKVIRPDQKKINMVMYLFPLEIKEDIMKEAISKMRDKDGEFSKGF
ncbi:hypothetical protein HYV49_00260 [Candidatus Pacearchaeota archaeon]|nr:hypothetical protein [Candidatus Pacearchaeota archaeon]